MKLRTLLAASGAAAALSVGCNTASGHKVLAFFFDGVPPPGSAAATAAGEPALPAHAVRGATAALREHGPYAAKLCDACHDPRAMNRLVVPVEQLCGRCHELDLDRRYVHGPLAAGGCTVCHDPHSSRYGYLLVSESDGFCLTCHDRGALPADTDHAGEAARCTDCHDAHKSDQKYLLKAGRG